MDYYKNIITNDILKKYICNNNTNEKDFEYYITNEFVQKKVSNKINNYNLNIIKDDDNSNDPWEDAINDNKFYINNKITRIFPTLKNSSSYSKIKIDEESLNYITIRETADITSKIICYHLLEFNLNPQKIVLVDYTSGVGGNVLSFSKYFYFIHAIEISKERSEYLQNNIELYGLKNIKVYNTCAINFNNNDLIKVNPGVIFIDPPWGGSSYKNTDNLLLSLGDIPIEDLVINICKQFSDYYKELVLINPKEQKNNYNNKLIILKLPKNYDIVHYYFHIKNNNTFDNFYINSYLYILNKMLILVCQLKFI
jgi:16S rRNA G966 N2-methylase RsmD